MRKKEQGTGEGARCICPEGQTTASGERGDRGGPEENVVYKGKAGSPVG